jgi:hypothetical protein
MSERKNFALPDEYRKEAERLDLEMHARLEAGLLDTEPKSLSQLMPAVRGPEKPSLWQALKRFFH